MAWAQRDPVGAFGLRAFGTHTQPSTVGGRTSVDYSGSVLASLYASGRLSPLEALFVERPEGVGEAR